MPTFIPLKSNNHLGDHFEVTAWVIVMISNSNSACEIVPYERFADLRTTEGLQSKTHHRTNLCLVLTSPKS
jgi:hypothetical protein